MDLLLQCVIFLCLLGSLFPVDGLYFHIRETDKKCFLEEIPEETLVMGKYKLEYMEHGGGKEAVPGSSALGMHVTIVDPNKKEILSRTYAAEGRFTFTSHVAGEHSICLYSNSTAWFGGGKLRVHLDFEVGEHANDYKEIATKEKFSQVELRVRQLIDQAEQIQKEQAYQRSREERFRETSESTNERVLYWSLVQVVILLFTGFWQLKHLKSFFEAKKLV